MPLIPAHHQELRKKSLPEHDRHRQTISNLFCDKAVLRARRASANFSSLFPFDSHVSSARKLRQAQLALVSAERERLSEEVKKLKEEGKNLELQVEQEPGTEWQAASLKLSGTLDKLVESSNKTSKC